MRAPPSFALAILLMGLFSAPVLSSQLPGGDVVVQRDAREADGAQEGERAEILGRNADLELKNVLLEDALGRLHDVAGVPLLFSPSLLPGVVVDCDCRGATVEAVLDRIVRGNGLDYLVRGGQVMIFRSDAGRGPDPLARRDVLASPTQTPTELRTSVLAAPALPLVGVITGRVTDARSGQPVASAQVYIQDLEMGALTQQNGRYLLQAVQAGTYTMTVQRIGYRTASAEITVADDQTIVQDFVLTQEAL
ncbi:MAG: carboxypeptidase-like regulatory domain-containing protein, partial [Gemmatimonadota bacterium]